MNTIFGKYINSGNTGGVQKDEFAPGDTIVFYPANGQISNTFTINDGGAAYTNGDTLTFASQRGTNATANVSTNSTGGITAVTLITAGQDYRWDDIPAINVTSSGGSGANISATITSGFSLNSPGSIEVDLALKTVIESE